jgi:hypothetical protein
VAVGSTPRPAQAAAPGLMQFTSGGHALGFTANGIYAATGTHALRVDFVNANNVQPLADSPAGMDGQVAALSRVTYSDLWPGISLTYDAPLGNILRSTYTLQPGADSKSIRLRYNAPLILNDDGTLGIAFETGTMLESAPIAWQEIDGRRVSVDVRFFLPATNRAESGQTVAFNVGAYNPRYPLTIDPNLTWNTFLGGSGDDVSHSIALDGNGNIYVAGNGPAAWSCTPADCTVRPYSGDYDTFVAKLDGASGTLVWNTFLGGSGFDNSMGIAVDGSGNVYVSGYSSVAWGNPLRPYTGDYDAFIAKLDGASGALTWNTFLGGTDTDRSWGIAVDGGGNVYVTGNSAAPWSCSPTDCTVHAFGGLEDAFIAKLDAASGALNWNTFLGGSGTDVGYGIAADGSGNIYVTGYSTETWGNPLSAYSDNLEGFAGNLEGFASNPDGFTGNLDGFAAKLTSSGALTWNTFLGGSADDVGYGIAVDGIGNVFVTGRSNTTWGIPLRDYSGDMDGFAAKLTPSGALAASAFLGGSGTDKVYGIALFNGDENIYVSGYSGADWGNPLRAYSSGQDAFAVRLDLTPPIVNVDDFDTPGIIGELPTTISMTDKDYIYSTVANDDPLVCGTNSQGLHTIWYSYTATAFGEITVDTFGSSFDSVVAIWTGTRGNLKSEACNDDSLQPGYLYQSEAKAVVIPGTKYYIEVTQFMADNYAAEKLQADTPQVIDATTNWMILNVKFVKTQSGPIRDFGHTP